MITEASGRYVHIFILILVNNHTIIETQMKKKIYNYYISTLFAVLMLVIAMSCARDTDDLELATYPTTAEVFIDGFSGGLKYAAFGGSDVKAFDVDKEVKYKGTASMRFAVPDAGNPKGSYAGGVYFTESGRDLSQYNCLTFWVKASKAATIDLVGFGNDLAESKYQVSMKNLKANTNWKKVIIPIPDASKLTSERGMLFYSEGPEDERGYTFWIDEVKFEYLGTLAHGKGQILDGQIQEAESVVNQSFTVGGTTVLYNMPEGINQRVYVTPSYFSFTSSSEEVATVTEAGKVKVIGLGEATIKGIFQGKEAEGGMKINVIDLATAPVPEVAAEDVISIFSDAYTNITVDYYNGYWQPYQKTESTNLAVNGDNILSYTKLNFVGIQFTKPMVDAAKMNYLHIDVLTLENVEGAELTIELVDFGADGAQGTGDDTSIEHKVTPPALLSGKWMSLNIPLGGLAGRAHIAQIIIKGNDKLNKIYVDNIYFTKEKPGGGEPMTPSKAAPKPTHAGADVISIFSDAYTNVEGTNLNPNWGQATVVSELPIGGNNTLLYKGLNYQGIQFGSAQDVSSLQYVHLDFWTGNATTLNFYLISDGGGEKAYVLNVPTTGWTSLDIPLSAFSDLVDLSKVIQFKFDGDGDIYLDNMYFHTKNDGGGVAAFCGKKVQHFGIEAEKTSAILLTVTNVDAQSMKVEIESADSNPVDVLVVNNLTGPITGSPAVSATDNSVAGKLSQTLTWADTPPENVELCILWSKESTDGNWQLSEANITVAFADKCDGVGNSGGNEETVPMTVAPTPNKDAANVISIFSDAYTDISDVNLNPGWGQATVFSEETIDGNKMVKLAGLNYQGIDFDGNHQDVSAMEYLHLDVWTKNATALNVFLISPGKERPYELTVPTTGWASFDIPLSAFSSVVDLTDVFQLKFEGNGDVFIDNIYFYKEDGGSAAVVAQSLPIDFEKGETLSGAFDGGANGANVANPDKSGSNTSEKVYQFNKVVGSAWYSGMYNIFPQDIDLSKGITFKLKIWSPKANVNVRLQLEKEGGAGNPPTYQIDQTVATANTWQELTFNFSSTALNTADGYDKLVIFPDYDDSNQNAVATEAIYYIDDITQE